MFCLKLKTFSHANLNSTLVKPHKKKIVYLYWKINFLYKQIQ